LSSLRSLITLSVIRSSSRLLLSLQVVIDRFTKMAYFIPTTEKTSIEGLAQLFRNNIWKLHELPDSIIPDRRP